jgi:thymidylate kinase
MLVSLEGQDGSGKTTLLPMLVSALAEHKVPAIGVAEFSDGLVGRFVRDLLAREKFLRWEGALSETMHLLADLYSQDELLIRPALQARRVVLKDRYLHSIVACQLPKILSDYPEQDEHQVYAWLKQLCARLTYPALTVFLSVGESTLQQRLTMRGEPPSTSDWAVFKARERIYNRLANEQPECWLIVPNDGDPQPAIRTIVSEILRWRDERTTRSSDRPR